MTWPDEISVAVNISAVQFKNNILLDEVSTALAVSKLPANRLELEITESAPPVNTEATLTTLERLRGVGIRIAMDDFGTGYSSLSYLRRFPFDRMKVDRSFVKDVPQDASSLAVVRAVAGLGRSFCMETTAEGVELLETTSSLCAEGITALQGFLFATAPSLRQ